MRHDSFRWDMTRWDETWLVEMRRDSLIWLIHKSLIRDMTQSDETWLNQMRHDSFRWDMTRWDVSFISHWYETWLIRTHMNTTHSDEICLVHMRHDSSICLIHMRHDSFRWDMTHSYETCLMHPDTTHSYVTRLIYMRRKSFTCVWRRGLQML